MSVVLELLLGLCRLPPGWRPKNWVPPLLLGTSWASLVPARVLA